MDENFIVPETDTQPEIVPEPIQSPRFCEVFNCVKLNIREAPTKDSKIVTVVPAGTILEIDEDPVIQDLEWYPVCTEAGVKGYCMKCFVKE